ncbi:MAG: hypothetical protein H6834_16835 [Planctomycetes bacterium]|nr:hypothetical protein [Planctomycetota bacterium]
MRSPTVYCGPMWGGKTEALISALVRARIQEIATLAFNPSMNARYGTQDVRAHSGASFPATPVRHGDEILAHVSKHEPQLVGIDEFFMIEGAIEAVRTLRRRGTKIVIATLDMDSDGRAWESVGDLLGIAEDVVKCPAVCARCKADAYFTFRRGPAPQDRVLVGANEFYEPRCWPCFDEGQQAKSAQIGRGSLFERRGEA